MRHVRKATFNIPVDDGDDQWKKQGFCRSYGWPELWFPEGRGAERRKQEETAADHCRLRCPVLDQCRRYALDNRETNGVWAGLTETELRKLVGKAGS